MTDSTSTRLDGPESPSLLVSKLRPRSPRPDLVPRPRLLAGLEPGLAARLVLVSAPAGFGKTTLVASWLAGAGAAAAWLSLDRADDDPSAFVRYLFAAVERAAPGLARTAATLYAQQARPAACVAALLDDLGRSAREVVLVLDDYHLIESTSVHSLVADVLDHLPPNAHLVIVTRADPPLPLARLRSLGELCEVRAADLRFSAEEAGSLLNDRLRLGLSPGEVASLADRTEGWIAGLQLAALALRRRADVSALIDSLGQHRFVVDYLLEEVLSRQASGVRAFLLRTSILGQVCGPLADAVTRAAGSQSTLELLERANAFVVPLDDEKRWYRYHQLFADLLQARLLQEMPGEASGLHARAAAWHEAHGDLREAISHALAAPDPEGAAKLIARNWRDVAHRGETETVRRWLAALPESVVIASPTLCLASAWTSLFSGDATSTEARLTRLNALLVERKGEDWRALASEAALLRSFLAQWSGDVVGAAAAAARAADLADPDDALRWGGALLALGFARATLGDVDGAIAAFEAGIGPSRRAGNKLSAVSAAAVLARTYRRKGLLRKAEATCRQALAEVEADGLGGLPPVGALHGVLADVVRERNDLAAATAHAERGLALGGANDSEAVLFGNLALSRIRLALGDLDETEACLARALEAARATGMIAGVAEARAEQARLAAVRGVPIPANDWGILATPLLKEIEDVAVARGLIASGDARDARRVLGGCLASAEAGGRLGNAMEILTLDALAAAALGRREEALASLGRALSIAVPEGFARVFLDEGPALERLLRRGLAERAWSDAAVRDHAELLLRAATVKVGDRDAETRLAESATAQALAEPLSDRELEVLRLIALGRSNQEIASELVISLNTVKKHTSNVFGKLGVASRTRAVARARELGLV